MPRFDRRLSSDALDSLKCTGRHRPKSPSFTIVRSAETNKLEGLMSRCTSGVSRWWRKCRAAQSCEHHEKDTAFGGRHAATALPLRSITSSSDPPPKHSIATAGSDPHMSTPTMATTLGCCPTVDMIRTSFIMSPRVLLRVRVFSVKSGRTTLRASVLCDGRCRALCTCPTDPLPITAPNSNSEDCRTCATRSGRKRVTFFLRTPS
mmetsp:Transcript_39775/g.94288  ORF Transcript_39775/g.94288 Transcript_39775/m.94288 type:complete len:206 (+) Transcript_39775:574-1191(+)